MLRSLVGSEMCIRDRPQAVSNTKKIMRDSLEKKFIQTYEDEADTQNSILGNDEFKEGVAAFFEKRKPVFK